MNTFIQHLLTENEIDDAKFSIKVDEEYMNKKNGKITKNINFKGTNIIGFMAPFEVNGNPKLIEIGYETGFEGKGSMGFGMVKETFERFEPFKLFKPLKRLKLLKLFFFIWREEKMSVKYFEDLEVWILSRKLTNKIYNVSNDGRFAKDFGLRDQIRRAAVSIMSNIAEGYERGGNQEFIQFLSIAKASCGEVRSQLYVAMDQNYINKKECEQLIDVFKKLSIMINNFIEYLKGSRYKGTKYKMPKNKSV